MKNRAKMISLLMAVCMMITLLPAVAFAAASKVMIGNAELSDSNPYYHNGTDGAQGTADNDPTNANATFDAQNGILTLNNLNIVNVYSDPNDKAKGISWAYTVYGANNDGVDLTIVLADGTTNIVTNTRGSAIVGRTGQGGVGPSLTIRGGTQGTGKLIATGSTHGIWVWENITITDNANVIATGVQENGISTNGSASTIRIEGNASVYADGGKYGIGYDHNNVDNIYINTSNVTSKGGTAAFQKQPIVGSGITETKNGSTSTFGDNAPAQQHRHVFFDPNVDADNFEKAKTPAMPTQSVASGDTVTLADYTVAGFGNWDTKSDDSGVDYANKAVFAPQRNTILYAQKASSTPKTYYVRFMPGYQGNAGLMDYQEFTEGVPQAITNNSFEREGYTFIGWKDQYGKSYTQGQTVELDETIVINGDTLTLTAQWDLDKSGGGNTGGGNTGGGSNTGSTPGTVDPGTSSGISLWYNGGNSFGSSNSAVPTSVEIDGVPVSFNGNGREFTVGCISPNAKWVTVNWNSTSVTTNFTPDANAACAEITLPKTGDVSVMAFALMAVVAAAGAMGKK